MKLLINKRIGSQDYTFQVEGGGLYEVVTEANKLSFPDVERCGCCGSENISLQSRLAQNKFKYVFVKCHGCKAELTFGRRQDDSETYFLRKDENGKLDWQSANTEHV